MMTFSKFAQILYPLIGNGQKNWEFIIQLTTQIMEIPNNEEDKKADANDEYYPLNKRETSLLGKIYNGKRNLSQKSAIKICSHLDKSRFSDFLGNYPADVITSIYSALQKNDIDIINKDAIETCTDLFESILRDCAQQTRKPKTKQNDIHLTINDTLKSQYPDWYAQSIREQMGLSKSLLNKRI